VSTQAKAEAATVFADFLRQEGYLPEIDADGDVRFKCEGLTYLVVIDPDDPAFFRLVLPGFWSTNDEAQRRDALAAANHATATTKVAKIFVGNDSVSGAAELFTESPAQATAMLRRCLAALQTAVRSFVRRMQS
jgi:hypothetical protein